MNINLKGTIVNKMMSYMKKYDENKYWKRRQIVVDPNAKVNQLIKYYYLLYVKRSDFRNNASMGTDLNAGASFKTKPILPHGLNGVIISHFATIGSNCTIFHQVSIAQDEYNNAPIIGDNVLIGAGAKILGNVKIGDNVNVGANAVVVHDVPSNCTVVGIPAKIVKRHD